MFAVEEGPYEIFHGVHGRLVASSDDNELLSDDTYHVIRKEKAVGHATRLVTVVCSDKDLVFGYIRPIVEPVVRKRHKSPRRRKKGIRKLTAGTDESTILVSLIGAADDV